ncbi:hypothetical protein IZU27_10710 [Treponema socranskii]
MRLAASAQANCIVGTRISRSLLRGARSFCDRIIKIAGMRHTTYARLE